MDKGRVMQEFLCSSSDHEVCDDQFQDTKYSANDCLLSCASLEHPTKSLQNCYNDSLFQDRSASQAEFSSSSSAKSVIIADKQEISDCLIAEGGYSKDMSTCCYEQGKAMEEEMHLLETNSLGQDDQQSDNLQVFKELPFYSEDSNVGDKMESKRKPGPKVKPKKY